MAKYYSIVVIVGITLLGLVSAEPPLLRLSKRLGNFIAQYNRKLFTRQEQTPDAESSPSPYPPAGVTPEIPFDLPTETETPLAEPDQTYGPPESSPGETYLPPKQTPDQTYGPPVLTPPDADASIPEPDNTYIPATTDDQPADEEPSSEELPPSENNLVFKNLIQPQKIFAARSRSSQLRFRAPSQRSRAEPWR